MTEGHDETDLSDLVTWYDKRTEDKEKQKKKKQADHHQAVPWLVSGTTWTPH